MSLVDTTRDAEEGGAGQDSRKREQIMRGASQVFLEKGFDAASMNDIARAAGVSKGTLYVYFENKERLFIELISAEKREELFRIVMLDFENHDVEAVLKKFGRELCTILTKPYYIKAMRSVFSIINRMPEVGAEFYSNGPMLCTQLLAKYLDAQTKAGILEIEDCLLAAQQFVELSQSGVMRSVLFGVIDSPGPEEIARRVDSAVTIFMKAYKAPQSAFAN
ncbi:MULTISPECIES: TetR/AcrR family transcriptional regulator C-terminal domain-containing protein [Kaistia]|uniref:TetR/AcrR family transcriptional regulator n=1 Tax=Kaistia nematophila TaxID=2994654 RepID=A0A9X3E3N1_9HYPH|nr:TetR/AcrR family transcriptional regulator [Hyphomicrobiales bacterium]MBN9057829.1 TetR/AcrR family transcriptional regulator [Hyphomicrobiales bacterium]MCX5570762.1 TetR/AcrR family transcriptional regulator [Kaistia nematophila]